MNQKNSSNDLQKQIDKITQKRKQIEEDIKNLEKYKPKRGTKKSGQEFRQVTLENNKKSFVSEKDFQKHVKTWEREYAKFVKKDQEFYQKLNSLTAEAARQTPGGQKKQKKATDEAKQKKQKQHSTVNKIEEFTNNVQMLVVEWEKTAVGLDVKGVNCVNAGRDFLALSKSYFVLSKKYIHLVEKADHIISSIGAKHENYSDAVNQFDALVKKDLEYQYQAKSLDDRFLIATKVKTERENRRTEKQQAQIKKAQERADKQKKAYEDSVAKENARQAERQRKQELDLEISELELKRMEMRREKKLALEEIKNRKRADKEKAKKRKGRSGASILGGIIHAPFKAVGIDFSDEARLLKTVFKPVGKVLGKVFGKTQDSSKYALPEGLGVNDFADVDAEIQGLRHKKKFEKVPTPQPRQSQTMGGAFNSTYNSNTYSPGGSSSQSTSSNQSQTTNSTSSNQSTINNQPLDLNRSDDQNPIVEEIKKTNDLLEKILKKDSKGKKDSGGLFSGLGSLGGIFGGLAGVGRLLGSLGGVLGSALRGIGALIPMLPAIAPFALGAAALGTTVWAGKELYNVIRDRRDLKQTRDSSLNSMTETMTQKLMESGAPKEVIEKFADLSSKRSDLLTENDSPETANQIKQIDSELKTIQKAYIRHKEDSNVEKINNNNQKTSVIKENNQKVDISSTDQKTSRINETITNDKTVSEEFQDFLIGDFLNTLVKKLADQLSDKGPGISRMPGMNPF